MLSPEGTFVSELPHEGISCVVREGSAILLGASKDQVNWTVAIKADVVDEIHVTEVGWIDTWSELSVAG